MKKNYVPPFIEMIEVEVEAGFAVSTVVTTGKVNDFTTNSFGESGGSTMTDY